MRHNIGAMSLISRAMAMAVPIAALQIGLHESWMGAATLVEVARASVTMATAVALVLVVLDLIWPSVRRGLGLRGASETIGFGIATALGISVSTMVLSWLHGLFERSSRDDDGLMTAGHHEMDPLEHAFRDGGAVAPLALLVVAALPFVSFVIRTFATDGVSWTSVGIGRWSVLAGLITGLLVVVSPTGPAAAAVPPLPACGAGNAVRVYDVAATNVFIPYTRWANDAGVAVNGPDGFPHFTDGDPDGMVFVLQRDQAAVQNWHRPLVGNAADGYAGDPAAGRRLRPRPLVLRANAGECIQVTLTNELDPAQMAPLLPQVDPHVSMHAFGVSYAPNTGDGSSVGHNADTTVGVGEAITYFWRAPSSEGLYLFRDMGMPAGANADGGGAEHGLYGGLAVQPAGARWFDPVTGAELSSSVPANQYLGVAGQSGELYIDAAIALADGRRYRETVQLSQDVIPVVAAPAVPPAPPIEVPERFSFNYGSESEYKRLDFKPEWCADCVGEETGLSSWTFGDPATVKLASGSGPWLPVEPDYAGADPLARPGGLPAVNVENCGLMLTNAPDETRVTSCYTANVARAYQGDPIKIRFGHAGVFETHVFHLHAHTWAAEPDDNGPAGSIPPKPTPSNQPRATTIDSQTYSPWAAFTADLNYGGGARIGTVGDSIFHCHLYPHFAAGFWSLLRVHDAHEDGTNATPDGHLVTSWVALEDIGAGIVPVAASVPPAKNAPSFDFPGYPRFIPGQFGWRAPQAVGGVFQRAFDPDTREPILDAAGNPVEAPAMRIVAGKALDPALLESTQDIVATATDGSFTLSFGGATTTPINLPATAVAIENALEALPNIEAVLVDGEGTDLDPWAVQLVLWRSTPDLTITAQYTPEVPFVAPQVAVTPIRGSPDTQSVQIALGTTEFTLTVDSISTTPVDYPADAAAVEAALESLPVVTDALVTGDGSIGTPYIIEFVTFTGGNPTITGTTTAPAAVGDPIVEQIAGTPETQELVAEAEVVAFTLTVGAATTEPIPGPAAVGGAASALAVRTALEALPNVTSAVVSGAGVAVDPWVIELGLAVGTDPTITTAVTDPLAPGVVVTPEVGFFPADPDVARIAFQLAQEQHTTRKFHDPTYVAGGPVDPANAPLPGAPAVDPCPAGARTVTYRASVIQLPIIYNEADWIDFQGRILVADEDVAAILAGDKEPEPFFFRVNQGDCINFELTNRTPNHIGNDAYQRLVQTNMVGGHIHLVNFDVLASDGSSNGWNYQQAAFTEAQATFNDNVIAGTQACNIDAGCTVPLPAVYDPTDPAEQATWLSDGQTLKERWYADYELRTVFMHDHHFAAVMQNRGMFNALIVEPAGFDSRDPETGEWLQPINNPLRGPVCGAACVGTASGATMDMVGPGGGDDFREYGVAVHDFIPLFMPPNGNAADLTLADIQNPANTIAPPPAPTGAAENDQGGMAINYKNAPMELRQFPAGANAVLGEQVDPAYTFSSRVWGDPWTPTLKAYRGDNIRYRLIQGSHEEQHNFSIHGTRWRKDANDPASPYVNTRPIGVSEAFNVDDVAVGCGLGQTGTCFPTQPGQPRVSDFLYGGTGVEDLWFGAWGVMRVFDQTLDSGVGAAPALLPLPDNNIALPAGVALPAAGVQNLTIPAGGTTADGTLPQAPLNISCPPGSTLKSFDVSVIDVPITYNRYGDNDPYGLAYVLTADAAAIRAGTKPLEPLVLRANEGDCIVVNLTNDVDWDFFAQHGNLGTLDGDAPMPLEPLPPAPLDPGEPVPPPAGPPWFAGNRVSMHPSLLRYDVRTSDGATVGYSLDQTAGPGQTRSYLWYADEIAYDDPQNPVGLTDGELGVIPLTDFGDVRGHRHHGLLAALVVGPRNATFHDQITGAQVSTGAAVDVRVPGAAEDYRDAVVFHHNGLNIRNATGAIQDDPIPADWPDLGERAISYKNAPLHHRLGLPAPLQNPLANGIGAPFNQLGFGERLANVFSSIFEINGAPIGDPDTPIIRAYQGDPLRVHVVQSSDRARMLETEISGHNWLEHAFDAGSMRAGVQGSMATGSAFTFHLAAAGGDMQNIGDYRYGVVHGISGLSAGSWGIVRVYPTPAPGTERVLSPLATSRNPYNGGNPIQVLNQDLLPPAGNPTITLTTPLDFGVIGTPAQSLPVSATVTVAGNPLGSQPVEFTWSTGIGTATATATATSGPDGVATIQVPVLAPARTVTVTATVDPPTTAPASANLQLEFLANEVIAPTVMSVDPSNASIAVNSLTDVVVTLSERVHPNSVTTGSVRLLDGAVVVPSTVTLSADRLSATLVPVAALDLLTTYTVDVTTAVTDLVGNALAAPFTSAFTTWTVPGAPTIDVATPGDQSATVEWTAPPDDGGTPITGFDVSVYDALGVLVDGLGGTAGPSAGTFDVTGLVNGTQYQFAVTAVNAAGAGAPSALAGPVTPTGVPGAPTGVTVTPVDGQPAGFDTGRVTVSWTAPDNNGSDITGYTVRYGAGNVVGCSTMTETSCEIGGLFPGQIVSFNVTATNATGDGPASAGVLATPRTVPQAPQSASAVPGNGSADVSWSAPAFAGGSAVTSYEVRAIAGSGDVIPGLGGTAGPLATSLTVSGLTNGVGYRFAVVAVNAAGESLPATTTVVTPARVPDAPTGLGVVLGDGAVTVSWVAPVDVGGSALVGFTVSADPGVASCNTTDPTATSCVVTGLTKGSTYTFEVVARNTVGQSVPATIEATVPTPPAAPVTVSAVPNDGSITVTWTPPTSDGGAPISSYVATATVGGVFTTCSIAPPATTCTITGLTNDVQHLVYAQAVNVAGLSPIDIGSMRQATPVGLPVVTTVTPADGAIAVDPSSNVVVTFSRPLDPTSVTTGSVRLLDAADVVVASTVTLSANGLSVTLNPAAPLGLLADYTVDVSNTVQDLLGRPVTAFSSTFTTWTIPDAPTAVTATPGNESVLVSWTPAFNGGTAITGYQVRAIDGSGDVIPGLGGTAGPSATSLTITGLTNGEAYQFAVFATNAAGDGPLSAASDPVVPVAVPDPPTVLGVVLGDGAVTVSWLAPVDVGGSALTGFRVTAVPGGASCMVGAGATSCVVVGLTKGSTYTFEVVARNAVGGSVPATIDATVPTPPSAPVTVSAVPDDGSIAVTWSEPVSDGGAPISTYVATATANGVLTTCSVVAPATTCTITGLANGVEHLVYVRAVNVAGLSPTDGDSIQQATPAALPVVTTVTPADEATAVDPSSNVVVTFSRPLDPTSVTTGSVRLLDAADNAVTSTVTVSANGLSVTLNPAAPLGLLADYTVDVSNTVQDLLGRPVTTFSSNFTTWTVPEAPTNTTATPGNESVSVSWTPPASDGGTALTGYQVRAINGSGEVIPGLGGTAGPSATSLTITGLTNAVDYRFVVVAVNAAGESAASDPTGTVTPVAVPDAPTGVTVTPVDVKTPGASSGRVVVSWIAPDDNGSSITGYTVRYGLGQGNLVGCNVATTSCEIGGLFAGQELSFNVTATNSVGVSLASVDVQATPRTVPWAPQSATVVAADESVSVSWTPPSSDGGAVITGYEVRAVNGSGAVLPLVPGCTGGASATDCTVTGLTNGASYRFAVLAANAAGDGPLSAASSPVVPVAVPDAPTGVSAVPVDGQPAGVNTGRVAVSWTAPDDNGSPITAYTVRYGVGNVIGCATSSVVPALPATTCEIGGLLPGQVLSFNVTATNAVGVGNASPFVLATPRTVPSAPQAVSGVAGDRSVSVSWTPPTSAGGSTITGYAVRVLDGSGAVVPGLGGAAGPSATSLEVTGLTNGVGYRFAVVAVNAAGESAATASSTVTPIGVLSLPPVAGPPAGPSFVPLTPARLADTRASGVKVGSADGTAGPFRLNVFNQGGLPGSGIGAVALNVTAANGEDPNIGGGYVTVYPCGTRPDASNLNFTAGQTIPNAVIAPVSPTGDICFYVYGQAHLIVDVSGYFPAGNGIVSLTPARLADTRASGVKVGSADGTAGPFRLNVFNQGGLPGSGIGAVALNVTAANGEDPNIGGGYVTVYPCGTRPDASNLNFTAGQTIPNAVIAPVSPTGDICFYVYGQAHLIVDVSGYFPAGNGIVSLTPARLADTRASGVKVGSADGTAGPFRLNVFNQGGLPGSGIGAVALNVTAANGEDPNIGGGYVTVYPCGTRPDASNLNFTAGQTIPNAVIAPVSPTGDICFYVYGQAHLIVDVSGYFPT